MNRAGQRKVVLVLGMHRSGTSALMAGIHYALDIPLAIEKNHAGKDNPKGFFENSDIVQLNDRLLSCCGASWDKIGACLTLDAESPEYKEYRRQAIGLLNTYFEDCLIWGMKDPRFSVLLPFWEEVLREFGAEVYRMIALRHPLEVALSQQARHRDFPDIHLAGGELAYTLNLWYWYNVRLLRDLHDDRNWIVGFDELLAHPDVILKHFAQILDMQVLPGKLENYSGQFLEKELKKHNISRMEIGPFQNHYAHVFTLYERLKTYGKGGPLAVADVSRLLMGLPDEQLLQSWILPMYAHVDTLKSRLQESRNGLAAAKSHIQSLQQADVQKEHRNVELQAMLQDKTKALAESQGIAAGLMQRVEDCRRELSQVSASRDELRIQLTAAGEELSQAREQVASGLSQIQCLRADMAQKDKTVIELKAAVDKTMQDLVAAQSTLHWQQKNNLRLKAELDRNNQALAEAQTKIVQKDRANAELESAIRLKAEALNEALSRIELAERDIAQYREGLCQLEALRDAVQGQADTLRQQVIEVSQQNEQALSRIQGLQDELGLKEKAVAELNAAIESKTKSLDDARHEMEQKMQEIARYRSELYEVYTSGSWRYTVWFRKIRRVFK
ncbi:MAG: hypothetical protein ABFD91_16905 [Anaerohalosphaeraceae bacterium]